ncbi:hypothetical protein DOM21_02005 [Bacteriovorax stolpii]|uniref:Uncharacterized protein n=1 Tax=Bacteriovorax stolpii TaxID=960 RepID=A0A2K9NW64_BACTC|nr:hypothetical protein [Bacteriovorax stolpii]AUN99758.1 hypothetical protein C0V70_16920 [Bacteriovorax stolpii]QDK40248.1 hypothetical protein DOM21_02005 [Bacteriovorax stolpii]TDP54355.1 hypothetical protein C8D79_1651 [Bacteriovorax stolpii]
MNLLIKIKNFFLDHKNIKSSLLILTAFWALCFWGSSAYEARTNVSPDVKAIVAIQTLKNNQMLVWDKPFLENQPYVRIESSNRSDHNWYWTLTEGLFEFLILGLLVFVWEKLHQKHTKEEVSKNQKRALTNLTYFIEIEEDSAAGAELPPFKKAILEINNLLAIDGHEVGKWLGPVKNELLFHNLESVLTGYQDLMIDGTDRDSKDHEDYLKVYQALRSIKFLHDRFMAVYILEEASDVKLKANLVLEMIHHLSILKNHVAKIVGNDKVEIDKDILCRLWNAIPAVSMGKTKKSTNTHLVKSRADLLKQLVAKYKKLAERPELVHSKEELDEEIDSAA